MTQAQFGRVGGDVVRALEDVSLPAYCIGPDGIISWLNPAAERLVGDVRGKPFTAVVAPGYKGRAREAFAQKILGTARVTDLDVELLDERGEVIRAEVSSAPLVDGHKVVGVFGVVARPPRKAKPKRLHPHLTPRQAEVLHKLAEGASTEHIAEDLHLSRETVRNHVQGLMRTLQVHSRVEAVAVARDSGLLDD
jgi:PAS domain S-box-containing protein